MASFHFHAQFLDGNEGHWWYRNFPDHAIATQVWVVFTVDPRDGSWHNETPADAEQKGLVAADDQCIAAIVGKLRSKHAAGPPPTTISWLAGTLPPRAVPPAPQGPAPQLLAGIHADVLVPYIGKEFHLTTDRTIAEPQARTSTVPPGSGQLTRSQSRGVSHVWRTRRSACACRSPYSASSSRGNARIPARQGTQAGGLTERESHLLWARR